MINLSQEEIKNLSLIQFTSEDKFQSSSKDMIDKYFPEFKGMYFHPQNETGGYHTQITPELLSIFPRSRSKKHEGLEDDKEYIKRVEGMRGAKEKHKGKQSGVLDWIIPYRGIFYRIELKLESERHSKNGGLSDEQVKIKDLWDAQFPEIPSFICYNLGEVYKVCRWIINNKFRIVKEL